MISKSMLMGNHSLRAEQIIEKANAIPRRISGAHVHVDEDGPPDAKGEKVVTLSGTKESILLAQFLVQSNVDMAAKDGNSEGNNPGGPPPGGAAGDGGGRGHLQQRENGPPPGQQQQSHNRQQNDPRLRGFRGRRGGGGGGRS